MSRAQRIHDGLVAALAPLVLELVNESRMHSVPPGSETHFKVIVVSDSFVGRSLVERHRTVHAVLADELSHGLHALSIHAFSPAEWQRRGGVVPKSPPCLGGSKADAPE